MSFNAFKMDGLGNDFIIIDCRNERINLSKKQIIKLCDRSFIGCDQLILINKSNHSDAELVFYNSDGSESTTCGNGTRCVAYLISKDINKNEIILTTKSGNLSSKILDSNLVETVIGKAKTNWNEIPISKEMNTKNLGLQIKDKNENIFEGGIAVNVGNPHTIFFVDDINKFDLNKIGPLLENDTLFPQKCNITLARIESKKKISVKVWERGAGLTKACGSAACAAAFAARVNNLIEDNVEVVFELGNLSINIADDNIIKMKGPVSDIKMIEIEL